MSEIGKNIIATCKDIRKFFGQVSLLLNTADSLMMDSKLWEPAAASTAIEGSNSLVGFTEWLPYYIFRFYKHRTIGNIISFVSVLLDLDDNPTGLPLISAGWFQFEGNKIRDWKYIYCRNHLYRPGAEFDGTWSSTENPKKGWNKKTKVVFFSSMARPLVEIENTDLLQSEVVTELLKSVKAKFNKDA